MAHYQWRKFQFFNDGTPQGALPEELQKPLWCSSCDRSYLFFGTADGTVLVVDRSLKVVASFSAHGHTVSHIQQLKQRNILVTVGEDDAPPAGKMGASVLKLWDMDKLRGEGGAAAGGPPCLKTLKVFTSKFPEAEVGC
jgi:WD40 repeat protein